MTAPAPTAPPGTQARALLRGLDRATLATLGHAQGQAAGEPYASLVLVACMPDARPILLISRLADPHAQHRGRSARLAPVRRYGGLAEPLTGARVSVQGRAVKTTDPLARARYLARHPSAEMYAGFGDFAFHVVEPRAAHIVAGFGRIHWFPAADLVDPVRDSAALVDAEPGIVAHMNEDHPTRCNSTRTACSAVPATAGCSPASIPKGPICRRGGEIARLPFARRVTDAEGARAELVTLVKQARAAG